MRRFFCLALSVTFMFGILFPVSRTREGKSPFIEQIKKIFRYSDGISGTEKTKVTKSPVIIGEGKSPLFQEIRNIFHYLPEGTERSKSKEYPLKFDKALEKELRYPHKEGLK